MKDPDELPPHPEEEQDDAVIGRALRRSIWVFAGLLCIGAIVWVIQKWPEKKGPEVITEISVPTATQRAEATVPKVVFTDQTRQSGIIFKHVNGAYGDKLLPETMGSGVAVTTNYSCSWKSETLLRADNVHNTLPNIFNIK